MADVPHFDLPFRIDPATGTLAVVEQDSLDEIAVCVEAVCRTIAGERDEHPEFGIADLAFTRTPIDLEALTAQVVASEPRAGILLEQDPERFSTIVEGTVNLRLTVGQADG